MPSYDFRNKETGEVTEFKMKISELDQFVEDHPELERVYSPVPVGYSIHRMKPDEGFRDILRESKARNRGSTIEIP